MKLKATVTLSKTVALLLLLSVINPELTARAQGSAFTYQGSLNDGANPANGIYDLRFTTPPTTPARSSPGRRPIPPSP